MPMKTSTRFVKAAILNACVALVLCTLCEFLALYVFKTADASNGWIWPMFFINFVFSWCVATIIGMIPSIPEKAVQWAMEKGITVQQLKQIKAMERTRKSLQKQLDKLEKANQDDTLTFEQLGIDRLFVDEAHECTTRS